MMKGYWIGYGIRCCSLAISNAVGPLGSNEILLEVKTQKYQKYEIRHTWTLISVTLKGGSTPSPQIAVDNVYNR